MVLSNFELNMRKFGQATEGGRLLTEPNLAVLH